MKDCCFGKGSLSALSGALGEAIKTCRAVCSTPPNGTAALEFQGIQDPDSCHAGLYHFRGVHFLDQDPEWVTEPGECPSWESLVHMSELWRNSAGWTSQGMY